MFILREREKENECVHKWGRGRERGAEPDVGLELTNCEIMTKESDV